MQIFQPICRSRNKVEKITVVVAGNFFVNVGFSPIDAATHFRMIAAYLCIPNEC